MIQNTIIDLGWKKGISLKSSLTTWQKRIICHKQMCSSRKISVLPPAPPPPPPPEGGWEFWGGGGFFKPPKIKKILKNLIEIPGLGGGGGLRKNPFYGEGSWKKSLPWGEVWIFSGTTRW